MTGHDVCFHFEHLVLSFNNVVSSAFPGSGYSGGQVSVCVLVQCLVAYISAVSCRPREVMAGQGKIELWLET